ncbi:hypothetical protein ABKW14_16680, partial [Enterobacter roggenkampii]
MTILRKPMLRRFTAALAFISLAINTAYANSNQVGIAPVARTTLKESILFAIDRDPSIREVAIKWSAAPDMTPQTVLYRRPVAQFSNFQPKIVSSWLILAL